MWRFASKAIAGSTTRRNVSLKPSHSSSDCSDDEVASSCTTTEGLECPVCLESLNIVENIPYVLWCGHTICKTCILALQWDVATFPKLPVQLPLFISCPWCHLLSLRLIYKGELMLPRKNYFLQCLVESMNGEREKAYSTFCGGQQSVRPSSSRFNSESDGNHHQPNRIPRYSRTDTLCPDANRSTTTSSNWSSERIRSSLLYSVGFIIQLTAKFPLVIMFFLIALYAVPASAVVVAVYIIVTLVFGLPSFFMLYFAYPSLDWLVKELRRT